MPDPGADLIGGRSESANANDTPRFYIGGYALCLREQTILLVRAAPGQADAGTWVLPGGGVNWGEPPDRAALRELWEETGLRGRIMRPVGVFSATYLRSSERDRDSVHHIGIVYLTEVADGELRNEEHGSTDLCAWIPIDQLDDLPLGSLAKYGRELASHLTIEG